MGDEFFASAGTIAIGTAVKARDVTRIVWIIRFAVRVVM
jgi:hypothetical protein